MACASVCVCMCKCLVFPAEKAYKLARSSSVCATRVCLGVCGSVCVCTLQSYILVGVPVETGLFEDEPVFPPLLGEVPFSILLLPQPALTVPMAQVLTGDPPAAGARQRACTWRNQVNHTRLRSCTLQSHLKQKTPRNTQQWDTYLYSSFCWVLLLRRCSGKTEK